jgi:hypothetical protein
MCHRPQTDTWAETKHPNAYTDLPKRYQNDPTCLKCHVTGFGEQGGFVAGTDKDLLMVGCESCHGPGARHIDAAQRFVLATPGEEAQIEKEMRETIVKTPSDSLCAECHRTQAHGSHPAYEGQPAKSVRSHSTAICCPATPVAVVSTATSVRTRLSRYSVKTCGGCHYDQYKRFGVEKHSALAGMLPAKYINDESCRTCHAVGGAAVPSSTSARDPHHNHVGAACESCHGPALEHIRFNRQFISGPPLGPKLEQAARDSIRKGKPQSACVQCHVGHSHKEHPPFDR